MKILSVCIALFAAAIYAAWHSGLIYTLSASAPAGFYRIVDPLFDKGDLVAVCPMPPLQTRYARRGFHCDGYSALLKTIAAGSGDTVLVTGDGIRINAERLPNSKPLSHDRRGKPLTWFVGSDLQDNEFFVVSTQTPYSFDSRYFGLVTTDQIVGRVEPLWLF